MRLLPARAISVALLGLLIAAGSITADHHESEAEKTAATLLAVAHFEVSDPEAFETGLKAHNAFHAEHNDRHTILTTTITSGPRTGTYNRITPALTWADLDVDPEFAAADAADSATNVNASVAGVHASIYRYIPELSNPAPPGSPISRLIHFHLEPGKGRSFEKTIAKFHEAVSSAEGGQPYEWYTLVDGGYRPSYVLRLARGNWAGFEPDSVMDKALVAKYGPEGTAELVAEFFSHVKKEMVESSVLRPDLSYMPDAGE